MKAHINYLILLLFIATGLIGCQVEDPELGPAPSGEQVKFSASPSSENANIITFRNESGAVNRAVWDLGNGQTGAGDQITGTFPLSGDYVVKLTIYTSGGSASSTQTINIAQTRPEMLDRPDYNFLTGGGSNVPGKTWVIDKEASGHLGVGPAEKSVPEWYTAAPNEKKDLGFYDDEMTFTLSNNLAYTYVNNGDTFANGANAAGINGGGPGDDRPVAYAPPAGMKWSITEEGGKQFLSISGGGFIAYYTGMSKYEILALSDTELYLKAADKANPANAWYLKLVPKGYTRPIVEKPLKTANLLDKFDGTGAIAWRADAIVFKPNFDNPFPQGLHKDAKVAYYERLEGEANQYGNLQTTLDYRIDLSTRNKFKMKVFFPGGNEYPAVKQQVAVKLQNSLAGGNAWQTQTEIVKQVSQLNQWVELEFDFSSISSTIIYDQIVIQPGGEGHQTPGIFYLGLFELQ
ncbi:PKD domain-containing protein [Arcticibacter sp.]|uniref:PKD domain-containing protein n=1 Tax=Arcticibacter sp. TaxID=1872630 RepID=UPI00389087CB